MSLQQCIYVRWRCITLGKVAQDVTRFDERTEAAGDRLPSLDAASEIANGLPMQAAWQSSPAKIAASMDALDEDFANYDDLPSVAQACTVLVDHILAGIHGLRFSLRICLCSQNANAMTTEL